MNKKRFYIGIDPGVNTGFAEWDSLEKRFLNICSLSFWDTIAHLGYLRLVHGVLCIVIEDPNLNAPVFNRAGQSKAAMLKIAQNVGSNKRDAQLLIEWAEKNNFEVRKIKPISAKWDITAFRNFTKWEEQTNQHGRDAAKLIFGL